jgi:hypothetical protein
MLNKNRQMDKSITFEKTHMNINMDRHACGQMISIHSRGATAQQAANKYDTFP